MTELLGSPWPLRSLQKGQLELSVTPEFLGSPWPLCSFPTEGTAGAIGDRPALPRSLTLHTSEKSKSNCQSCSQRGPGASMPADRKGSPCRQPFAPVVRCAKCPGGGPPAPPGGPTLLFSTLPGCCRQGCPQLRAGLSQLTAGPTGPKTQSQALLLPNRLCCWVGWGGF